MATADSTVTKARYHRGDAAILHAQTILNERLRVPGAALTSPGSVRDLLKLKLAEKPHEMFVALWLDAQNRLIFPEELFRGTLTQTAVYPREVVKSALHHNAGAVIFAHNHPSGCIEPSAADLVLAARLTTALRLVDVKVLDHFIVGGSEVLSFMERGLLATGATEPAALAAVAPTVQEEAAIKHDFRFTATVPLYAVSEKANTNDINNQLESRLGHLCAMLEMVQGEGFERFNCSDDEIKMDYLWACAMAVRECQELFELL